MSNEQLLENAVRSAQFLDVVGREAERLQLPSVIVMSLFGVIAKQVVRDFINDGLVNDMQEGVLIMMTAFARGLGVQPIELDPSDEQLRELKKMVEQKIEEDRQAAH